MDARLASWLARAHGAPTEAQARTAGPLAAGRHLLLSSPTGSGKTLAAFLPILSALAAEPLEERTYCVYVSPLKALVNDMARNLAGPIEGAQLPIRVAVRTGDTSAYRRSRQLRQPPHILITTPESLALLLTSPKARGALLGVRFVVVDEIHSIAESKRGTQLALTLERLAAYAGEFQRVGLSATVRPLAEVAAFLGGDRPVLIVEVQPRGAPELDVVMPAADPLLYPKAALETSVLGLVEREMARSRTLLVFTNTRASAEGLARQLKARHSREDAPPEEIELVLPHHGSLSRETRHDVEARLKTGRVRCVVASSSLELGIHVDTVDRVLLLDNPKGSARTLQRIGRSGHVPGATARATLVVEDPCELPEAHALARLARERRVEDVRIPYGPLDVLMQHLVASRFELPLGPDALFALTRRAHSYRSLSRPEFDAVYGDLPRMPRFVYMQNAGTIPETSLLKVFHKDTYVGEIEEDFASRLEEDSLFLLAGRAWRYVSAGLARIHVVPARGDPSVPIWRGEGLGATTLLAEERCSVLRHAKDDYPWMELQERWAGHPCEGALVESFPAGTWGRAVVFHAHLGRRANSALACALALRAESDFTATDWGFALLRERGWKPSRTALRALFADPLEPSVRKAIQESDLLRRRFRHVAMRALVVRRRQGEGLGRRQKWADRLLRDLPAEHPLVREAYAECLRDAMDVDAADAWRASVADGRLTMKLVDSRPCGSPLAARILAAPGAWRHDDLREHADAIDMYGAISARSRR
ncbi:MAG TPA: DEAD/DEAH box helicase [Candidatus Thermoplasmatota archaeon]|nr:DEAD/DEAH box helicase [Candidatus Thermoplasmatota archaeon]